MKDALHEQTVKLWAAEKDKENITKDLGIVKNEAWAFQEQYDKMFNSVSSLNRRIEELESHKKYLLDKIKSNTEKTDVDYIVKT